MLVARETWGGRKIFRLFGFIFSCRDGLTYFVPEKAKLDPKNTRFSSNPSKPNECHAAIFISNIDPEKFACVIVSSKIVFRSLRLVIVIENRYLPANEHFKGDFYSE